MEYYIGGNTNAVYIEFILKKSTGDNAGWYGYYIRIGINQKLFQVFGRYSNGSRYQTPLINFQM